MYMLTSRYIDIFAELATGKYIVPTKILTGKYIQKCRYYMHTYRSVSTFI